jgi:hypothetical protein
MFIFGFRWLRDIACSGLESAKSGYFNRLLMLFVELRNGASERNSNVVRSLRELKISKPKPLRSCDRLYALKRINITPKCNFKMADYLSN